MARILVVLSLVAGLVACDNKPADGGKGTTTAGGGGTTTGGGGTKTPEPAKWAPDAWKSWDSCKDGSSVTFDMDASGSKMSIKKTRDKKDGDTIKLKTSTKMAAMPDPMAGDEDVKKPDGKAVEGECALCKKPYKDHKDESKWSDKTMKVDGKDVKCHVMESAAKTCDGKDNANKMEIWYSDDVPGQMVMMKSAAVTMTATAFEKK